MSTFRASPAPTVAVADRVRGTVAGPARRYLACAPILLLLAACASGPSPETATPEPVSPPAPVEQPGAVEQAEPPVAVSLRVDHAWVRDAEAAEKQALQVAAMSALRAKVLTGGSFDASWKAMNLDPANWHVAEQEVYPADVLPPGVPDLADGAVSAVIPGDGGLHLFRVIAREPAL